MIKPRGVDLGIFFWEFLYLSFAVTRLKIGLIEKMRKNDIEIAQNGLPSPMKPHGHTKCLKIKVPVDPIKRRLQNKNLAYIKKDKIWQLTEARDQGTFF